MTHSTGKRQALIEQMAALLAENPNIKIAYYATHSEVADKAYLAKLKEALPGIDIIEAKPIPVTIHKFETVEQAVLDGMLLNPDLWTWDEFHYQSAPEVKDKIITGGWPSPFSHENFKKLYYGEFVDEPEPLRPEHKKDYRKFDRKTYRKDRY